MDGTEAHIRVLLQSFDAWLSTEQEQLKVAREFGDNLEQVDMCLQRFNGLQEDLRPYRDWLFKDSRTRNAFDELMLVRKDCLSFCEEVHASNGSSEYKRKAQQHFSACQKPLRKLIDQLTPPNSPTHEHKTTESILNDKIKASEFDNFLCHNSIDKPEVKRIGESLKKRGILPWLDEWELRPGLPWQRLLERQIARIKSAAVFIGSEGVGPWQREELVQFHRNPYPVQATNGRPV